MTHLSTMYNCLKFGWRVQYTLYVSIKIDSLSNEMSDPVYDASIVNKTSIYLYFVISGGNIFLLMEPSWATISKQ